jgi:outer membrane autotransporter protein
VDDGIRLVQVVGGGATTTDAFTLGQRVVAGAYEYQLFRGGDSDPNDWFLRSHVESTDPSGPDIPIYGRINQFVMLGGCIAIWLLSISAIMMWWKRRPKGRLGAPVAPPGPRVRAAVLGIVLPLAVLYPLTGLSLIAALLLDFGFRRVMPPSR